MICFKCGKSITNGSMSCPYCGMPFTKDEVNSNTGSRNGNSVQTAEMNLQNGTIVRDRYEIVSMIGSGGFCFTYKAFDRILNVNVAIKEYYPHGTASRTQGNTVSVFTEEDLKAFEKGKQRFLSEARALAKLNEYSGVVSIYDFFEEYGTAYIIMEYLNGKNLKECLRDTQGPLNEVFLYDLAGRICDTMKSVHESGIVHRDISPDNIYYCTNGNIKIIDFGALNQQVSESPETVTVILKRGFAPIEQYYSKGKQGTWTDIYAIGATLYNLATKKIPQESVARREQDELVPPHIINPRLSAGFSKAIMKAMSIDAKDRYGSVDEFKNALLCEMSTAQTKAQPSDFVTVKLNHTLQEENESIFSGKNEATEGNVKQQAGSLAENSQNAPEEKKKDGKKGGRKIVYALLGLALVAGIIVLVIMLSGKKNNKSEPEGENISENTPEVTSAVVNNSSTPTFTPVPISTQKSTLTPTMSPTEEPTLTPTSTPTQAPTLTPTPTPTQAPTSGAVITKSDGIAHLLDGICVLDINLWGMSYEQVKAAIENKGYKFSTSEPNEWWGQKSENIGAWNGTGIKMAAVWIDVGKPIKYSYGFYFENNILVAISYEDKTKSILDDKMIFAAWSVFYEDDDWTNHAYTYPSTYEDPARAGEWHYCKFNYTTKNRYINDSKDGYYLLFVNEYTDETTGLGHVIAVDQLYTSNRFSGIAIFESIY